MIHRYAMDVHVNPYQTTIKTIYGYAGLHATYDGDLRSSTEYKRNVLIPSPTTATVVEPYAPTVLETFKSSESHGAPDFGFCNANSLPKRHNLRDLILLDNRSTVDIFCNKRLLKNIHVSDQDVTVHGNDHGNGEALTTNKKGTLKNYGEVWYHEDAITNILSLKNVRSKFKLTYVSHPESVFTVHKPDGSINEFKMHQDGLHYFDTKIKSLVSISPVSAEVEGSSNQVRSARELQVKLGEPSSQQLKAIVSITSIPNHPSLHDLNVIVSGNCISYLPVSVADVNRAEKVSGPSLPILRGKIVRQAPDQPQSDCIPASDAILAEI